ncbi:beta-glucosidase family protein [Streptomyces sp. ME19-01-6]|uniref:beta-glucosidase family protein n=1 Tax=Streptomyces sp. ME19-01-6 TaxID=3028686 RepID=UPI0029AD1633|nr:glycoside hydrolase family 3 C-terminal domain-containing protein [Streptomyces sp. ME19-01-6]MDX3224612.1 glycoside hydrolase family 3 C-terminal domain-containing protein [Streptomyces sp. ME19-01-6]
MSRPALTDDAELRRRIRDLDLPSKIRLLTGASLWRVPSEPRLGLSAVTMSDGPQGVRGTGDEPDATGLLAPAPSALAAAWDTELAERLGALFAAEARRKGVDVVLAPAVNLQRTPVAGRHFEYFSEDPLLTGTLAAALVRGMQGRGVGACLKHFVANDSETDRTHYRARLDERTLREVYMAPFEQVLAEAAPWSVMAAYSGVDDGTESAPMSENARLLREVLKGEWGFSGPVVSDWAATRSTVASAVGGLDLVMPGPHGPWGDALVAAVRAGEVDEQLVDDKVLRLLRLARHTGRLGDPGQNPPPPPAAPAGPAEEEFRLLREVAARGTVLLRNEADLLPLTPESIRSVALIGPNAVAPYLQGGGSAFVPAVRTVSFEEGLRAALPEHVRMSVHRGGDARLRPPYLSDALLNDPDTGAAGVRADHVDAEGHRIGGDVRQSGDWSGYGGFGPTTHRVVLRTVLTLAEPGTHRLEVGCVGRFRATVDGEEVLRGDDDRGVELILDSSHNNPPLHGIDLEVGPQPREIALSIDLTVIEAGGYGRFVTAQLRHAPPGPTPYEEIAEAAAAAQAADVAVVVVGTNEEVESEGWDRTGLDLPGHQDELVRKVIAANPRTIVVVNAGAPVLLPWADEAPALLWAWLPGQEAGHALADVLLGRIEPSGRLPWTLPARAEDVPVPDARPRDGIVDYGEGVHVGHRAWDREGIVPAFPFGHGLGWTRWTYESVTVSESVPLPESSVSAILPNPAGGDGLNLTVELTNTGPQPGREVVQVYLEPPQDGPDRPVRLLAGFATVHATPGASVTAEVCVPARALEIWDTEAGTWRTPPGRYRLHVGRSSRDPHLTAEVTVDDGRLRPAG